MSMMQVARDDADAAISGHTRCHGFCNCVGPMAARYPYAGLFLLANFYAWMVRESHVTFFQQQLLSGCAGNHYCLQADGVLRISMTMFLFFGLMTLSTMFTRKLEDFRSFWHSQWWVVKTGLLVICSLVISTLAPADWIQLYANVAPFGAGVFIFIQLISVIRYITRLNYKWCLTNFEQRYAEVITVSILAYNVSTIGGIFMILWYIDSWFNTVLIGTTLLLVYVMLLIALKSKAKGRYMEPGLVGVYIGFLCLSAIRSEPKTHSYPKEKGSSSENWEIMISFVIELISIVVAVFSTGNDCICLHLSNVVELGEDVPYGYGFFHFVFAMGSMYFGMVFTGWDTHHTMEKWNMDVGWMCTWVHIVNEGLAVISFVAILLARINDIVWLRQLLGRIFGIGGQQQVSDESHATELQMDTGPPPSPLPRSRELQIFGSQIRDGPSVINHV